MSTSANRKGIGGAYLTVVPWVGTSVLLWAIVDLAINPPDPSWAALAALTILTGSFTVKIPGLVARLSVSEPFVFAATLWFGPSVGAVTAALDALVMSFWLMPGLKTLHRLTFNISVLVISIWIASQIFFSISAIDLPSPTYDSLSDFVVPLYIFTASCFLINSGMVAAALAIEREQSTLKIWREQFLWLSLNYFGGASVAALLVVYAKSIDWAVIGLIVPLLAISYLTFRTTLGRLEDANKHLIQLNHLHLSTIETLAMAVDAKDQVTHGHIRRVQKYALGLSSAIGVRDERLLRAIEAAALLHDMGKLAIPEYILNKPGRLTAAEFDKMKLHAALGADILSSIQFPYPVVPIVRHHHENWDGSGYPNGLIGTQIPLGARVLSVVDCYDALTSDRPYRPRLKAGDALTILMQRRGTMYDPLVVDAFIAHLEDFERSVSDQGPTNPTLRRIAELNAHSLLAWSQPAMAPHSPSIHVSELGVLLTRRALSLTAHTPDAVGCAFYAPDTSSTSLSVTSTAGNIPDTFVGVRTEPGKGIVGWAAATRSAVMNASMALEFGALMPFEAETCSAFPISTSLDTTAVLAVFGHAHGLPGETLSRLNALVLEVAAHASKDDRPCTARSASSIAEAQINGAS